MPADLHLVLFPQNPRNALLRTPLDRTLHGVEAQRALAEGIRDCQRHMDHQALVGFVHDRHWARQVHGPPMPGLDVLKFQADYVAELEATARRAWGTGEAYDWSQNVTPDEGQAGLARLARETAATMMPAILRGSVVFDGCLRRVATRLGHTTQRGLHIDMLAGLAALTRPGAADCGTANDDACHGRLAEPCSRCGPFLA